MMNLYFAPLEGITTATYRNAHSRMFQGVDAYYAPFITPSDMERISTKNLRDILPKNNICNTLEVQVLTNKSESFFKFVKKAEKFGYTHFNINLGCPFSTVVKKGRGAGFLKEKEALDRFLYEIFSIGGCGVSLKTRTGFFSGEEMHELMDIYNKYPLSLLIVHPRARQDFYNGEPDLEIFDMVYKKSVNNLCYNGNIFSKSDFDKIHDRYPNLHSVMIGRGAVKNPAIFREIKGGKPISAKELIEFSNILIEDYMTKLQSEYFTLNKLKEVWMYMMWSFPEEKKILKAIKKSTKLNELQGAISSIPEL